MFNFSVILEQLKIFLTSFVAIDNETGKKALKYKTQLSNIAHREQVDLLIELDDIHDFDDELAISIANNTRRYVNLLLEVSLYL